jgi:putative redox protein
MKITTRWNDKMTFSASDGAHSTQMDTRSPIGSDSALTPKQLVVAGLAGCTAMDVVALLKKHKQSIESFEVDTEVEKSSGGYPEVFTSALLTFRLKGAIHLHITTACGFEQLQGIQRQYALVPE